MRAYIEKLVVEGFKSYGKERKEIPLGPGFTAIVGPNGSGKSNIGDAISFALGIATTKTLRAKNLSYLIFSKENDSASHAYVEVHFRNSGAFPIPDDKVVISRKVTRDGRSTFKVNGTTVRERDLKDFLAKAGIYENGYNVVLQGDIVKFLKMTPVERRKVIEDIAGISEYEAKKEKAQRDLIEVDIKIGELKLLLEEIKGQLEKLKQDKEKLQRYRNLKEKQRELQIKILSKEAKKFLSEKEKLEEQVRDLKDKLEKVREEIKVKEEDLRQAEEKLKQVNDEIMPFRERIGKVSSDLEHVNESLERIEKERFRLEEEKQRSLRQLEYLRKDLKLLQEELKGLHGELKSKEREVEAAKNVEETLYAELKTLDDKLKVSMEEAQKVEEKERKLKEHIEKLKAEESAIRIRLKEIELKVQKTLEDIKKLKTEKEEFIAFLENSSEELDKIRRLKAVEESALKQSKEYLKELENKLSKIREALEEIIKSKAYVESKLASLEPVTDIFEDIEGVYGTVGDLISVKDPQHMKAVEVAGGARLRYVVVEDEEVARKCIQLLKERGLGRMSFIPLSKIRADLRLPPYPRTKGAVDFAVKLIDYDPKFERAIAFVFGDTLVVEDFDSAKRIGIGTYRMVTLEGEVFEKSGVISGGSHKGSGDLGRKAYEEELQKLHQEEEKLRNEEQEISLKMKALRSEIAEKEGVLKVLEKKFSDIEKTARGGEEKIKDYEQRIAKAEEYINILKEEEETLKRKLSQIKEDLSYSEDKLKNLTLKRQDIINYYRESGIEEKRLEYERAKRKTQRLSEDLQQIKLALKDKENQIKNLEEEINRIEIALEQIEEKEKELKVQEESLMQKRKELEDKIKDIEASVYNLYKERDALEEKVKGLQANLGRLRFKEEDLRSDLESLNSQVAKVTQKLEDLTQRLKDLGFQGEPLEVKESSSKLKGDLAKVESELQALGSVNLRADLDYEEELARYKDYEEKYERLQEERRAIKEMIEEIETKKLKTFMEAYENINRNLKKIFSFLSPGGKAQMFIENEYDPFSGGINLVVKPRGKDVQYLEAMSGGEKTLAALALIFAIQEYKPSPFYYFDEVDAHLDEANARRVGELIREKSKEAQFIVVTLREVLATFADKLIGVSARGGVSRVFPVENISNFLREVKEQAS